MVRTLLWFLVSVFPVIGMAERSAKGLVLLYDFGETEGTEIKDQVGEVHLQIKATDQVEHLKGSLRLKGSTVIASKAPPKELVDRLRASNAFTLETWITPANRTQEGPARIFTLSSDTQKRNFTLGQEGDRFDARLRTSSTDANGLPSTEGNKGDVQLKPTHLVFTRQADGSTQFWVNGKKAGSGKAEGNLGKWTDNFKLGLGNEMTGDRQWEGTFHLVALYDRVLAETELAQHFKLGPGAVPPPIRPNPAPQPQPKPTTYQGDRIGDGLLALYDFQDVQGNLVQDVSGLPDPLHLRIEKPNQTKRSEGQLEITGDTILRSEHPASRIANTVRESNAITIEAWIEPSRLDQEGPARIVTFSRDSGLRNFTLGQEGPLYDVRLSTDQNDTNGSPSLEGREGDLTLNLTHVVYTRQNDGRSRIFLNGKATAELQVDGVTTEWDEDLHLALGNELTGDRSWKGTYHLVAIYGRELDPPEVLQNYKAGPGGSTPLPSPPVKPNVPDVDRDERLFTGTIAPILARNCLECHDSIVKKGKVDLSRQATAFAKDLIKPGDPEKSVLWDVIETGEMPPEEREPLSDSEKVAIKNWIAGGAPWTREVVNPADFAQSEGPARNWMRRLTVDEYINTVRDVFGVEIGPEARKLLPPDLRADGFRNTAYNLGVDFAHIEAHAQLAPLVVSRMDVREFATSFERSTSVEDKPMKLLLDKMGRHVLRGPLRNEELIAYRGIATTVAAAGGDWNESISLILEAMMQSPRFLYLVEKQHGSGWSPVTEFELASRLSYLIWGSAPDKTLLSFATGKSLLRDDRLQREIERMLDDPRAIERSLVFASDWLHLDRLENMQPNRKRYPNWSPALSEDMRAETLAFFREIVWEQKKPLSALFNSQLTFTNHRLAEHYGLPKPAGDGLQKVNLSDQPERGGLLTQGSILTMGGDEASMVTRGLFVLHDILRGSVKDPPPGVDTTPVPSEPGLTQRAIAQQRVADKSCGGCHSRFEPLAYGLERYDGLGGYTEKDHHGNTLRHDGEVLFPGAEKAVPYSDSAELMDLLAESDRVKKSLTWKLCQFAIGRPLVDADVPILEAIHAQGWKDGGTYADLLRAIAMSDLIRKTTGEPNDIKVAK